MTSRTKLIILLFIVIISSFFILQSCGETQSRIMEDTKFFMGTIVQIKLSLTNKIGDDRARDAMNRAFGEIKRVEDVFSVYKADSEASRINRLRMNERLLISREVFDLIRRSIEYSEKTGGAFDITIKPLVDLWAKAKQDKKLPAEVDVKLALEHTGYKKIVLNEAKSTISFRKEGMALDFGGIAKGYATDRAIKILHENGIDNAVVRLGGSIYCLGRKSRNEPWKIGIQHPRDKDKLFLEIKLENVAIDTSGDYERYFVLDGKRYSHIIDPRTGYPIGEDTISSTVIAPDAVTADILATSLEVVGTKGVQCAESVKGVDVIMVFERGGRFFVNMSDGIRDRYEIVEENL